MLFKKMRARKEPVTLVGRWLAAGALDEPMSVLDARREELDQANWPHVESVLSEAFRLAIAVAYAPGMITPNVSEYVRGVREHYRQRGDVVFTQAEGEALVRAARGEDVSIAGISGDAAMAACYLFFLGLVRDLSYTKEQVYELLVKAEELAAAGAHESLIWWPDR